MWTHPHLSQPGLRVALICGPPAQSALGVRLAPAGGSARPLCPELLGMSSEHLAWLDTLVMVAGGGVEPPSSGL